MHPSHVAVKFTFFHNCLLFITSHTTVLAVINLSRNYQKRTTEVILINL